MHAAQTQTPPPDDPDSFKLSVTIMPDTTNERERTVGQPHVPYIDVDGIQESGFVQRVSLGNPYLLSEDTANRDWYLLTMALRRSGRILEAGLSLAHEVVRVILQPTAFGFELARELVQSETPRKLDLNGVRRVTFRMPGKIFDQILALNPIGPKISEVFCLERPVVDEEASAQQEGAGGCREGCRK